MIPDCCQAHRRVTIYHLARKWSNTKLTDKILYSKAYRMFSKEPQIEMIRTSRITSMTK